MIDAAGTFGTAEEPCLRTLQVCCAAWTAFAAPKGPAARAWICQLKGVERMSHLLERALTNHHAFDSLSWHPAQKPPTGVLPRAESRLSKSNDQNNHVRIC